jgi:hypothetical protein
MRNTLGTIYRKILNYRKYLFSSGLNKTGILWFISIAIAAFLAGIMLGLLLMTIPAFVF